MTTEIKWNDNPIDPPRQPKDQLIRCGIGTTAPYIVLADAHIGGDLHFYSRRSIPCQLHDCPYCKVHCRAIWKGYMAVWSPKTRTHGILEFTRPLRQYVVDYAQAHGTLRTANVQLNRKGTRINGPLGIALWPSEWVTADLPPAHNIRAILAEMWDQRPETIVKPTEPPTEITTETPEETNRKLPAHTRFNEKLIETPNHPTEEEVIENFVRNAVKARRNGHPQIIDEVQQ